MINFPDYRKATNAAYKLIAERDQFSLATNVFSIAEQLENCRIYTYGLTSYLYGTSLECLASVSEFGFSIQKGNKRIIYYNEKMPLACIRFTLAHEIAHAVLQHEDEDDPAAEKEANCFARNLLCPVPVINAMELESIDDYMSVFNVSTQMACVAVNYRSSDRYYIDRAFLEIIDDKLCAYHLGYESLSEFERYILA